MPLSQSSAATADPSEAQLETLQSAGSSRETLRESEMDWKGAENKKKTTTVKLKVRQMTG